MNLLLACGTGTTGCHGFYERNRALARSRGWLVSHGNRGPASVPVWYRGQRWVWLTDDGLAVAEDVAS